MAEGFRAAGIFWGEGRGTIQQIMLMALTSRRLMVGNLTTREVDWLTQREKELSKWERKYIRFSPFFTFFSSFSLLAPKREKMIPVWEFRPTAVTSIRPDPSITWVPEWNQKERSISVNSWYQYLWNCIILDTNFNTITTFTFMHLADGFIQRDLKNYLRSAKGNFSSCQHYCFVIIYNIRHVWQLD